MRRIEILVAGFFFILALLLPHPLQAEQPTVAPFPAQAPMESWTEVPPLEEPQVISSEEAQFIEAWESQTAELENRAWQLKAQIDADVVDQQYPNMESSVLDLVGLGPAASPFTLDLVVHYNKIGDPRVKERVLDFLSTQGHFTSARSYALRRVLQSQQKSAPHWKTFSLPTQQQIQSYLSGELDWNFSPSPELGQRLQSIYFNPQEPVAIRLMALKAIGRTGHRFAEIAQQTLLTPWRVPRGFEPEYDRTKINAIIYFLKAMGSENPNLSAPLFQKLYELSFLDNSMPQKHLAVGALIELQMHAVPYLTAWAQKGRAHRIWALRLIAQMNFFEHELVQLQEIMSATFDFQSPQLQHWIAERYEQSTQDLYPQSEPRRIYPATETVLPPLGEGEIILDPTSTEVALPEENRVIFPQDSPLPMDSPLVVPAPMEGQRETEVAFPEENRVIVPGQSSERIESDPLDLPPERELPLQRQKPVIEELPAPLPVPQNDQEDNLDF